MLAVKAIKGAGWLVFSRFVGRIIDFFTLLVLARILTPGDFGLAALATSLVVVVDTMLEVPVTQALVRLPKIDKTHLDTGFTVGPYERRCDWYHRSRDRMAVFLDQP